MSEPQPTPVYVAVDPRPGPFRRFFVLCGTMIAGWCIISFGLFILLVGLIVLAARSPEAQSGLGRQKEIQSGPAGLTVAVIPLRGVISDLVEDGPFGPRPSMVDQVCELLQQARSNADIKAVVLAIDSPGGGVTASDRLYQAVRAVVKAGKPVVAHMGDVCASGGYYVAVACDSIVASPTSITGSIGVIMPTVDLRGLLNTKLGIAFDPIKSGPHKDMGSATREMTAAERGMLQAMVDQMYQRFLGLVAQGRLGHGPVPKDLAQATDLLKQVADGRILTGQDAKEKGLADSVGYIEDAYIVAASLASLKNFRVAELRRVGGLAAIFESVAPLPNPTAEAARMVDHMSRFEYRWRPGL